MFDNKRQYQIPVYQRNYDWKKNSCLTLFNDIIDAYKNSRSHFLGSIVQVQQDEDNGIKRFIIIDGQQRMTSVNGVATTVGHARTDFGSIGVKLARSSAEALPRYNLKTVASRV